jgi:hypothetical protein
MEIRRQVRKTASFVLIAIGAVAMFASTQQDRIWWILVWFMLGMTCLSLLLLRVSDAIADWLATRRPWWAFAAFIGGAAGGLAAVALVIVNQWPPLTMIVAMVVMTIGIVGLFEWFSGRPDDGAGAGSDGQPVPAAAARLGVASTAWYGFEAMAIGIGLLLISDGATSLIGAVVWLGGLVTVKIGSLNYLATRGDQTQRTVRILIDVALFGLFVLFAGAFGSNSALMLAGLSVATASLSMAGVGALHLPCPPRRSWWAIGLSLGGMAIVWGWMAVVTQNPGLAFVLGLMIALVGGFFILRGEGIVLLMLAGYILAWGLVDRSAPPVEAVGEPVQIVALGDSFISGEGALKFFEGTNAAGGNQCRRAPTSYPYLIATGLNASVRSLACSGAKIADLTTCGQMWPDGRRCRTAAPVVADPDEDAASEDAASDDAAPDEPAPLPPPESVVSVWADSLADFGDRPAGPLPQLVTAVAGGATDEVDVVLVSIGGNDVGFSSIVKACLLPKGCDERREIWLDAIDLLGPQLDEVYGQIRVAFPNAHVLVMPYPMIVNAEPGTSCDLGLSQDEREFVVDFIHKLDLTIADAAGRAEFEFVDEGVNAYDGHQLCDEQAGANHLKLVPPEGVKLGRYSPATWIPGSMHPNVLGHELTAAASVCAVADALAPTAADGELAGGHEFECTEPVDAPVEPAPVAGDDASAVACEAALADGGEADAEQSAACAAVAEVVDQKIDALTAEVSAVAEELVSDDEWIRGELFRTVRALALPLVLLLALGMVFAWGFVRLDNPLSRFLHQEQDRSAR